MILRREKAALPPPTLLAQATSLLTGLIVDPKGNALPRVSVSLMDGNRVLARAATGSDGRFQLPSATTTSQLSCSIMRDSYLVPNNLSAHR